MINRVGKEASIIFQNLNNVDIIEQIIKLFNTDYFYGECFLDKADLLESDYFENNEEIKIIYIENLRKHKQLIIGIPFKFLKKFVSIAEKLDTTLGGYSGKVGEWDYYLENRKLSSYDIKFSLCDNYSTSISFDTEKYDLEDIIKKVETIIN